MATAKHKPINVPQTRDMNALALPKICINDGSVVGSEETLNLAKLSADLNFNPIECYTAVALIFFVVLYPVVQGTYVLERMLRKGD